MYLLASQESGGGGREGKGKEECRTAFNEEMNVSVFLLLIIYISCFTTTSIRVRLQYCCYLKVL